MNKLTKQEEVDLVTDYSTGDYSYRQLAEKYNVSRCTVPNVIKRNRELKQTLDTVKKEAEKKVALSMAEFYKKKTSLAQELIDKLMNSALDDIDEASLRDKMGAIKILTDCFGNVTIQDKEVEPTHFDLVVENATIEGLNEDE